MRQALWNMQVITILLCLCPPCELTTSSHTHAHKDGCGGCVAHARMHKLPPQLMAHAQPCRDRFDGAALQWRACQLGALGGMLAANAAMTALFVRGLRRVPSLQATVVCNAANMLMTVRCCCCCCSDSGAVALMPTADWRRPAPPQCARHRTHLEYNNNMG
jgi:hypothetical protein